MMKPLVSVIIPTYNGAAHLGAAIQSVLDQTFPNFELIVVSDASPDQTTDVVRQFNDSRLVYIIHETNRGADVARHTGLHASSGEIIALLDQDDLFHPEKLKAHVVLYETQPDVGFTYNDRFDLNYSSETIRTLWQAPRNITLEDLVFWFPLAPSDVVMRRTWALQMDLLGGSRGAEISHFGGLFLDGCQFACVERALNFRRYHSGRIVNNIAGACASELAHQAAVLADPRCPVEVSAQRHIAHANLYIYWAYHAFSQQETAVGQDLLRNAVRLKPSIVDGLPGELVAQMLINSIDDMHLNHEEVLRTVFDQFPKELAWLAQHVDWVVGRGYLLRGTGAVIWNRPDEGRRCFEQAAALDVEVDEPYLVDVTHQLQSYEAEFGAEKAQNVFQSLSVHLEFLSSRSVVRRLSSYMSINRAFQCYRTGEYAEVPPTILRAVAANPRYLSNRGLWSVLVRSAIGVRSTSA